MGSEVAKRVNNESIIKRGHPVLENEWRTSGGEGDGERCPAKDG